jgi:hypothetical protein
MAKEKEVVQLEEGEGDIIIDLDVPSRTVGDEYIEDIKRLREYEADEKVKTYDNGVSVEVVEYIQGQVLSVTKVRFKGL